jgi:hypothetical protein
MASEEVQRAKRRRQWIPNEPMDPDHLNKIMPIGTKVRFYPGPREMGSRECEIRGEFFVSDSGCVVCFVTGQSGYVSASRVERV